MEGGANRKKTSVIWSHFSRLGNSYASCDICSHKLSYKTSSSNLRKHLERKHPTISLADSAPAVILHDLLITLNDEQPSTIQEPEPTVGNEVEIATSQLEQQKSHVADNDTYVIRTKKGTVSDKRYVVESSRKRKQNFGIYASAEDRLIMRSEKVLESDEYYGYAISVAAKLRKMDEKQRLFAEKIINDATFKGMFNQLSEQSMIFTPSSAQCTESSNHNTLVIQQFETQE